MKAIKLVVLFFVLGSLKIVAQSAAPQSTIIPNGAFNAKLQSAQNSWILTFKMVMAALVFV